MNVLCVLGKYQYGNRARGTGPEYNSFIPALERLGHTVKHFELSERQSGRNYADLNRELLKAVEEFRPELILTVQRWWEIWTETLEILRVEREVKTVCWTTDDSWKYREFSRLIGRHYDCMVTTYPSRKEDYHRDGIKNVHVSQWGCPSDWLAEPLPARDCRYPVSFIGAAHGTRRKLIDNLRKLGIEVNCFGYGWEKGPCTESQMREIVRNSRITLNFANTPHRGLWAGEATALQVKARTFEVPGMGGFLLTEKTPGVENFYRLSEEIVCFTTFKELAASIHHYLAHPEERDSIAMAGHLRTRKEHTWDRRMEALIEYVAAVNKVPSPLPPPDFDAACARYSRKSTLLNFMKKCLVTAGNRFFGGKRGARFARRALFEAGWRIAGEKVYSAAGWPGRLFPEQ